MKLQHLKKALATVLTITLLAGSGQSLTARATEVAEDNAILNEEENTENQEGEATATDPIAPTGQEGEAALLEPLSLTGQEGEPDTLAPMATSSGKAGENATWTVEDGVLTISGSGEVTEKIDLSEEEKGTVAKVVVEAGITGFNSSSYYYDDKGSFKDMAALEEVVRLTSMQRSFPSRAGAENLLCRRHQRLGCIKSRIFRYPMAHLGRKRPLG